MQPSTPKRRGASQKHQLTNLTRKITHITARNRNSKVATSIYNILFRPWLNWSGEKSSELEFTAQSKVVAPPHVMGASSNGVLFDLNQQQITLARFLPPKWEG